MTVPLFVAVVKARESCLRPPSNARMRHPLGGVELQPKAFTLPDPAMAGRFWIRDLVHTPRALPPLSGDITVEFISHNPLGLQGTIVNGYAYSSPMGGPPGPPPAFPPGEALRNWETVFFPELQAVYAKLRNADYGAMTAAELAAFVEAAMPEVMAAVGHSILAGMQLHSEADRLHQFLEARFGAEAELLAAGILHGSGSETRSFGHDVDALTAAARQSPAAEAALRAGEFAAAASLMDEPWRTALTSFLADHEDEIAIWLEPHEPAWSEDPAPLFRLVAANLAHGAENRRDNAAAVLEDVRGRLSEDDVAGFEEALRQGRDFVPAIEHRARYQLKTMGGVRRAFMALGEKLRDAGVLEAPGDVFFLYRSELPAAAAGELDARPLVGARRAEWEENLQLEAPMTLGMPIPLEMIGMMNPWMRRVFGAVALPAPTSEAVTGIAASPGIVRGRARVVLTLDEAEDLADGDILVCPSTSPPWSPYFAVVAAVVTDAGGVVSHAAIEAREYGIPAVVGTRLGTRRIPDGAMVTVDGSAGTITIEA